MIRVVFDCMVLLQGAGRPSSPARACLQLAYDGQITLFLSHAAYAEILDVLNRPKVRNRFTNLTDDVVQQTLATLLEKSVMIDPVPERYVLLRDRKDSPYIDLALVTQANYLVTRDNDLLDLMDADIPESADFQSQFPELRIIDPVELLRVVRDQQQSSNQ